MFSWCKTDHNDVDYLLKQVEVIANNKLPEFKEAAKNDNKTALAGYTNDLLLTVKKAQDNNNILLPKITRAVNWISSLASKDLSGFFSGRALYFLVNQIDGKRDNISYYTFEAAREWVDRRIPSTTGGLKQDLESSRNLVVAARDELESNAQIFVQGIKKIKEMSGGGKAGQNQEQIRAIVSEFNRMKETMKLPEKTQGAIDQIQEVIEKLK